MTVTSSRNRVRVATQRLVSLAFLTLPIASCGDSDAPKDSIAEAQVVTEWYDPVERTKRMGEGKKLYGRRIGEWSFWHANGQLKGQGRFDRDLREGTWKSWHDNGQLEAEGGFEGGKRQGPWKSFHANGEPHRAFECKADELVGELRAWYDDGQTEIEGTYIDGKEDGPWTEYHRNGNKRRSVVFSAGAKTGVETTWHANGKKASEGAYEAGLKTGEWREYHDNGTLASLGTVVAGKGEGPFTAWYENGEPRMQGTMRGDANVGRFYRWFATGARQATVEFDEKGLLTGRMCEWFPNGNLSRSGTYLNGLMDGVWIMWKIDGSILTDESGTYEQNVRTTELPNDALENLDTQVCETFPEPRPKAPK